MRRYTENVFLVLASTLFSLLAIETGLRILGFNPFAELLDGREVVLRESPNPDMIYELAPGSIGHVWGTDVMINSHGFRDRNYSPRKDHPGYRIAVIGDSVTFGTYLPLAATYPKQLEQILNQRIRDRGPLEVMNLGVGGYDTAQEVALLETIAGHFDIDEVIVGYCMNDAGKFSINREYVKRAKLYNSPIYRVRTLQLLRTLLDKLESETDLRRVDPGDDTDDAGAAPLDDYVRERMRRIALHVGDDGLYREYLLYRFPGNVAKVSTAFDKLDELSRRRGFRVVVLIIPFLEHTDAYLSAYDIVRHEAEARGFEVIEVLEAFRAEEPENLKINPRDGIHPNPRGHRIIADELGSFYVRQRFLREANFSPDPSSPAVAPGRPAPGR